jgi:hypothetical protein
MSDSPEAQRIEALIRAFFAAFDNRGGRVPGLEEITGLFAVGAVIARHHEGTCEVQTPLEFARPRIALLTSGELTEFHEWEETASTRIVGGIAARTSRYAKSGRQKDAPYSGRGTKFFQLARFGSEWRIVALAWTDDTPADV